MAFGLQLTNVWSTEHRWKSTWLWNTKRKGQRSSEVFGRWTRTAWPDVKTSEVTSNTCEQYMATLTWSDLPHPCPSFRTRLWPGRDPHLFLLSQFQPVYLRGLATHTGSFVCLLWQESVIVRNNQSRVRGEKQAPERSGNRNNNVFLCTFSNGHTCAK